MTLIDFKNGVPFRAKKWYLNLYRYNQEKNEIESCLFDNGEWKYFCKVVNISEIGFKFEVILFNKKRTFEENFECLFECLSTEQ